MPGNRPVGEREGYAADFARCDEPALVRASLACPVCLRAPRGISLVDALDGRVAEITCGWCSRFWQVDLVVAQVRACR